MTDVEPRTCPVCSRPITTITRGRTHANGPVQPTTYGPCGCQPLARLVEPVDQAQQVIDWIAVHLAGTELTPEQDAFIRAIYRPGFSIEQAANMAWRQYRTPPSHYFTEEN